MTTPSLLLNGNPAWVIPMRTSSLPKDTLEWWDLRPLEIVEEDDGSQDDRPIDAITQLPIEDPVTLPSGQVIDRSTYSILL